MAKIKTDNGVIVYTPYPIYMGIKVIDKAKATENLKLLKLILEKNNIDFMLYFGTLLGAIRENDYISHDEDIDLALLEEDKMKFFNCLPEIIEQGFEIARYDRKGLLSIIRNGEYIDFYFFRKKDEIVRTCSGILVPEVFLINRTRIEFYGEQFSAPADYEGFLEFRYGANWRTPIKWANYEMPFYKRLLQVVKLKIKDNLPDCLYFRIAEYFERKQERFFQPKVESWLNKHNK